MKNLKKYAACLMNRILLVLIKLLPAKKGDQHLLVIKTDEIGDYILFRNLFISLKKSEKYRGFKVTLLGNDSWKKLYDEYDSGCFDQIIWLNKKAFFKNQAYKLKFLYKVRNLATSDVVNCIFSRSTDLDDAIAFVAKGINKICMRCNNSNRLFRYANQNKFMYTQIIDAGEQKIFDSVRNRNFVAAILNNSDVSADIRLNIIPSHTKLMERYFILFIGAGNPERKWPITYFAEVANYTSRRYYLTPVICGGPGDEIDANELMKLLEVKTINLAGKTTLPALLELLSSASFVLCVDTGTVHMAAAVGCPVIGLYSGKFYGRFAPYPASITTKFYPVYPDFVDKMIAVNDPVLYDTTIMKNDTIKMIPPQKVVPFIDSVMAC